MIKILLTALGLVLLSSCYRYQYFTLLSENVRLNQKSEFVAETDTLKITYDFYGKNGPVTIQVYNKSSQALEIDWKRSSLIIGDKPVSFYQPDLKIAGDITRTSNVSRTSGSFITGTIQRQVGIEFIPPHSSISRSGLYITQNRLAAKTTLGQEKAIKAQGGLKQNVIKSSFSKDNSPMAFRCYLTFVLPGKNEAIFSVEHFFYVSELLESKAEPAFILPGKEKAANKFFVIIKSN